MPVLASHDEDNIEVNVTSTSYPARTKQAAAIIDGLHTDVMSIEFADRIVVTITQEGRLAQWVRSSGADPSILLMRVFQGSSSLGSVSLHLYRDACGEPGGERISSDGTFDTHHPLGRHSATKRDNRPATCSTDCKCHCDKTPRRHQDGILRAWASENGE